MLRCDFLLFFVLVSLSGCNRNTYPCPDIQGGTEVVKSGSAEGLKKNEPSLDENGRLTKRAYTHPGLKKKKH